MALVNRDNNQVGNVRGRAGAALGPILYRFARQIPPDALEDLRQELVEDIVQGARTMADFGTTITEWARDVRNIGDGVVKDIIGQVQAAVDRKSVV